MKVEKKAYGTKGLIETHLASKSSPPTIDNSMDHVTRFVSRYSLIYDTSKLSPRVHTIGNSAHSYMGHMIRLDGIGGIAVLCDPEGQLFRSQDFTHTGTLQHTPLPPHTSYHTCADRFGTGQSEDAFSRRI